LISSPTELCTESSYTKHSLAKHTQQTTQQQGTCAAGGAPGCRILHPLPFWLGGRAVGGWGRSLARSVLGWVWGGLRRSFAPFGLSGGFPGCRSAVCIHHKIAPQPVSQRIHHESPIVSITSAPFVSITSSSSEQTRIPTSLPSIKLARSSRRLDEVISWITSHSICATSPGSCRWLPLVLGSR
jgi:hypothetical protein